jgi:hypothetical protein
VCVPDDGYYRNASYPLIQISSVYYYTCTEGIQVPEGIIRSLFSSSAVVY